MKVKNNYFLYLIFLSIAFKVSIFLFAEVAILAPDSEAYLKLAKMILNFDISGYNGLRTPGYPLIIALCNMNLKLVIAFQMVLGILTSLLMFKITFEFTSNQKFAFVSALTYLFYIPQFDYERYILTETTATFFTTASVYFCVVYILREKSFNKALISILLGCYAALIRPLLILLPFFLIAIFFVDAKHNREKLKAMGLKITSFALITIMSITSWSYVNYKNNQVFTTSTLAGYGMTNAVGGFLIPKNDQFKEIRDIYIKYRTIQIDETGSHSNTIYRASNEMRQSTGLGIVPLSMQLKKMCKLEIIEQPIPYFKGVIASTYRFWNPFAERNIKEQFFNIKHILVNITHSFILLINVIFITSVPVLMLLVHKKKRIDFNIALLFFGVYLFVCGSSVAQGMVEYGGPRYSLPYQPITSCFSIIFYFYFFSNTLKLTALKRHFQK